MDLNRVNITIRPRPAYEGLDLGFAMASRWFLTLWSLWLLTALPCAIAVNALCFSYPVLALIIMWWLKPLYETPLLYWISRRIFGENHDFRHILKNYKTIVSPRLLSRLTIRRFSPSRSFYMPVILLENMRGNDYAQRKTVLGHNQTAGITLTFICSLFELLLVISALALIDTMIPAELDMFNTDDFFNPESPLFFAGNAFVFLSMSVIAPFYIASGFALYLTRRTNLEAWDIELNFKRLTERKKATKTLASIILIITSAAMFSGISATPACASDSEKELSKNRIETVLESEDFGHKETVTYWKLRQFGDTEPDEPESRNNFFTGIFRFLAMIIKPLLWLAGGIVFVFFLYFTAKYMGFTAPVRRTETFKPPEELFGLKLTKDTLPDDIVGEVQTLLAGNNPRKALSLLYRGALFRLIFHTLLEIPKSATEGECVAIVEGNRDTEEAVFFKEMTQAWLNMAYGHILPDSSSVDTLCTQWSRFYGKHRHE